MGGGFGGQILKVNLGGGCGGVDLGCEMESYM